MTTLYLFRHAKSDWNAPSGADHDRPLAPRGVRAARAMGLFLARAGEVPERVVTSSAVRARTTVELASAAGGWAAEPEVEPALYEATPQSVLALLQGRPGGGTLLLAGHEPTFSSLAGLLVGRASLRFPTAAVARIDLAAGAWADVSFDAGTLRWLVPPKLLQHAGLAGDPTP